MVCVPSQGTRDFVATVFHSTAVLPHQQLMEWLDEIVPQICNSISDPKHKENILVRKTPAQKARGRPRAKKEPIDLKTLMPVSLRTMRYVTRTRKRSSLHKRSSKLLHQAKVSLIQEALASIVNANDDKLNSNSPCNSPSELRKTLCKASVEMDDDVTPQKASAKRSTLRPRPGRSAKVSENNKVDAGGISPSERKKTALVESITKQQAIETEEQQISSRKASLRPRKISKVSPVVELKPHPAKQVKINASFTTEQEPEFTTSRKANSIDLFANQESTIPMIDQSSSIYTMDFDANCLTSDNLDDLNDVDEQNDKTPTVEKPSTSRSIQSPCKTAVPTKLIATHAQPSALSIFKSPDVIKTYSKAVPIVAQPVSLVPVPKGHSRPAAQIVTSSPADVDVRTTRSKARQKIQEDDNVEKQLGTKANHQMTNSKNGSFLNVHGTSNINSFCSSSGISSFASSSTSLKTPATILKTKKYFNNLASNNSALKIKTPTTSSNTLFNSLFTASSSRPLPSNLAGSNVSSFIKRNTPVKMSQKEIETQQLEKLKQQDVKQVEATQKKDEYLKMRADENRRKREEREQNAAAKRKQLEEKSKRKIEEKVSLKEQEARKLQQQKLAEQEAKRKAEEEREKYRLKKEEQERQAAERRAQEAKAAAALSYQSNAKVNVSLANNQGASKLKEQPVNTKQSYDMTPNIKKIYPIKNKNNYGIDDISSGDETDDAESPKKTIPTWALGSLFKGALVSQYYADIDVRDLFGMMDQPNLEKIFGDGKKKRYNVRSSSACWANVSYFPFADDTDNNDNAI